MSAITRAEPLPASGNTFRDRWSSRMPIWVGAGVGALTFLLHTIAMPGLDVPEAAWLWAVPLLCWSFARPAMGLFFTVVLASAWGSWLVLIFWLHHVTWTGLFLLSFVLALFPAAWFLSCRVALPIMVAMPIGPRLCCALGLAAFWVLLEYLRLFLFTGFPWLPLAATQWQRPLMLQSAAWGGFGAVSFLLILFNLGLASYFRRLLLYFRSRGNRFVPELYLALGVLLAGTFGLLGETRGQERELLLRAGVMQPDIPQGDKWDPASAMDILSVLEKTTLQILPLAPEAIFWPEAVTPLAVIGNVGMQAWTEDLVTRLGVPLYKGSLGKYDLGESETAWYNIVVRVEPEAGLVSPVYRKRHLVPFGEYVPLRRWLPFVEKFVPIGGDFSAGTEPVLLGWSGDRGGLRIGVLICYEDIFPGLARASVREGASFLFVATNNAWFGEGWAAYQHAAHSVLRAVENRRPVLRVGNAGWSGWIDEYGNIRSVLVDASGSVYFRGGMVKTMDQDARWRGRLSFYTRWGDWLFWVCLGLAGSAGWACHRYRASA